MPWISLNDKGEQDIPRTIAELQHNSDRAAGIVGAVLVDESLTALLKSRMQPDADLLREMFRNSGPLGAFSSKINMGFLIGLYSAAARKELDTIKEIRNEFAHRAARDFDFGRIRDLANNLSLCDRIEFHMSVDAFKAGGTGVLWMGDKPPSTQQSVPVLEPAPPEQLTPRKKYMRACQFFSAALLFIGYLKKVDIPQFF